jgi:catechol 2,3-dioxygenase-like lactoylglutathione lyase family enzyme
VSVALCANSVTNVIQGAHTILYAHDPDAARAFFRDRLGLESVDAGGGWLIFALPPAELACHPAETGGRAELYLMCTDLEATRRELAAAGVEFVGPVSQEAWGLITRLDVPGYGEIGLYEPRHPSPLPGFSR